MTEMIVSGQYDWKLVALSMLIAVCASYAAFELAGRTANARGRSRTIWLAGGAVALGLGIWAMHYIAMLAFRMPIPIFYDLPTVAFSLLAAIGASWATLSIVSRDVLKTATLIWGSLVVAVGIATMHYTGMMAMRLQAQAVYDPALFSLSICIAVVVSFAALHLAFRFRDPSGKPTWMRLLSALVMALAIAAMHYCGMAAVCFHSGMPMGNIRRSINVSSLGETVIILATLTVLGLSIAGVLADRFLTEQRQLLQSEQDRWQLVIHANQDGLFDSDPVFGTVFFSPRWKEILGYGPNELADIGSTWSDRIHPDDSVRVRKTLETYISGREGVYRTEYRMLHRDGTWRWILANGLALWDAEGRAVRFVGSHSDITERKQALEELKASEARFSAFMQNSPYSAFIKDAAGRFTFANQTLERLWCLRRGEYLGKSEADYLPGDVAAQIHKHNQYVLDSGRPLEYVISAPTPDGILRHFLTTSFPFSEASGESSIGCVSIEITERVESENKLRASGSRYRELFERNPLPSWIYSLDNFEILDVNEAAIHHYGWQRSEFTGLSLSVVQPPDQSDNLEAELEVGARLRRPTRPLRHCRKNAPDIWVEVSSHKIESGGALVRLVMANDVTARMAAEDAAKRAQEQLEALVLQRTEELKTSEAKWRSLVEALPQFVWSVRADGTCDYVSNQWIDYTGASRAETLDNGWLNSIHPVDRVRVMAKWKTILAAPEDYEIEYRILSKEGTYRWFMARGRPIRKSSNGPVSHWLGTCTDIDDQKRSEERLESAVAERTVALAEARDRAESAAQAKSSFLAAMSHEIRTPMNGVIGMTTLLGSTLLNSEQRCYLDTIRSSGLALLNIINDVLDFSKIDAGKMELEHVEFDLQTLLEESMELIAVSAAPKNLELALEVQDDVPFTAIGDPGRLRQILLNLLSNAVKFTAHGSIRLLIAHEPMLDGSHMVHFKVQDTGIGMTDEQQEGLFQAFTQADRSTTRRFGGTGLGLSIAKRLVELMGGSIGVESRAGQGATFWFSVQLSHGNLLSQGSLVGTKLQLFDENSTSRPVIRRYLERAGAIVLEGDWKTNESVSQAESSISLIMLDAATLQRPSDQERLQSLALSRCPLLILGSSADWTGTGTAAGLTGISYIPKPVRSVPLLEAIQSALHPAITPLPGTRSPDPDGVQNRRDPSRPPSAGLLAVNDAEVLVVEDNPTNQLIAVGLLKKLGCKVELARNGVEACSIMQRRSFDLVFMDCQMPEMDGFEATRIIRSRESADQRTPIIALTAGVLLEERQHCFNAGMDDFISKPIPIEQLKTTLQKWLMFRRRTVLPQPQTV